MSKGSTVPVEPLSIEGPLVTKDLAFRMLAHAALAAVVFFAFQRYALGSTLETSALWSVAGAVGAAVLAWSQQRGSR
jgi:hypothetical protein